MKAIILAAGKGSRMGNMTRTQPKCFVELHGKRLIDWQMDALDTPQIDEKIIVTGYQSKCFDVAATYLHNPAWANTQMVYSLCCAKHVLAHSQCIISYSDIVYSKQLVQELGTHDAPIVICYDPHWQALWVRRFENPLDDAETFKFNGNKLISIGDQANSMDEIEGQYMGLLKISPAGWGLISTYLAQLNKDQLSQLDMTSLLQRLIQEGVAIEVIPTKQPWYEVDHLSDLRYYQSIVDLGIL